MNHKAPTSPPSPLRGTLLAAVFAVASVSTMLLVPKSPPVATDGPPAFPRDALVAADTNGVEVVTLSDYTPRHINLAFDVMKRGTNDNGGPYTYGLLRSTNGGATWFEWLKWGNDTFQYGQSVTCNVAVPQDAFGQLCCIKTFARNTPP